MAHVGGSISSPDKVRIRATCCFILCFVSVIVFLGDSLMGEGTMSSFVDIVDAVN